MTTNTKLKREQPIFFKKIPSTENTPANAVMNRYVGEVSGEPVVEIIHAGTKWLVKESECLDRETALSKRAEELNRLIAPLKADNPRKSDLAKALGICGSTLRRWNSIIQNFLPKTDNPTEEAAP